jgi:hypothetical protein
MPRSTVDEPVQIDFLVGVPGATVWAVDAIHQYRVYRLGKLEASGPWLLPVVDGRGVDLQSSKDGGLLVLQAWIQGKGIRLSARLWKPEQAVAEANVLEGVIASEMTNVFAARLDHSCWYVLGAASGRQLLLRSCEDGKVDQMEVAPGFDQIVTVPNRNEVVILSNWGRASLAFGSFESNGWEIKEIARPLGVVPLVCDHGECVTVAPIETDPRGLLIATSARDGFAVYRFDTLERFRGFPGSESQTTVTGPLK